MVLNRSRTHLSQPINTPQYEQRLEKTETKIYGQTFQVPHHRAAIFTHILLFLFLSPSPSSYLSPASLSFPSFCFPHPPSQPPLNPPPRLPSHSDRETSNLCFKQMSSTYSSNRRDIRGRRRVMDAFPKSHLLF